MIDLVAGQRRVFLLVGSPNRKVSGVIEMVTYEIDNGVIVEARVIETDPEAAASVYSQASSRGYL